MDGYQVYVEYIVFYERVYKDPGRGVSPLGSAFPLQVRHSGGIAILQTEQLQTCSVLACNTIHRRPNSE